MFSNIYKHTTNKGIQEFIRSDVYNVSMWVDFDYFLANFMFLFQSYEIVAREPNLFLIDVKCNCFFPRRL
jgi:hypothetical protein